MTDADQDKAFLQRWSRRKLAAHEDDDTVCEEASPASLAGEDPVPAEAPVLTDADMPPIESLDADSDFTPFMSPGVSDELRTRALRKLFRQPAFNITDGLNDYDEDFTRFAALGDTVTHEMKRMLQRELERQVQERPEVGDNAAQSQASTDVDHGEPADDEAVDTVTDVGEKDD